MGKSCIRNCNFILTHDLDFHGFLRHSGGTFSGIMPLILYCQRKKAPLLHTKPFYYRYYYIFGGGCINDIILFIAADTCVL